LEAAVVTAKSLEPIVVKAAMVKVYPQRARTGFAWYPQYSAFVPEVRLTAANGSLAESDLRDLPLYLSCGSKAEFKKLVKNLLPNATIVWPEINKTGR
jgi:hypothetical protein